MKILVTNEENGLRKYHNEGDNAWGPKTSNLENFARIMVCLTWK